MNFKHLRYSLTKKYSVYNEPMPSNLEEYKETKRKIINFYKNIRGIHAIYQMGSVSAPGISDLDIILVFDAAPYKRDLGYHQFLESRQRYLAGHSYPFVIDRRTFERLNAFSRPSHLKLLYGKDLRLQEYKGVENDLFFVSYSIDAALAELLWLLGTAMSGHIPLRNILCHLNAVKFDIKNVKTITTKKVPEGDEFIRSIRELRNRWFSLPKKIRYKTLLNLVLQAIQILLHIMDRFGEYLENKYINIPDSMDSNSQICLSGLNYLLCFQNNNNEKRTEDLIPIKNRFLLSFILRLKLSIGVQFFHYALHNSQIGKRVRRHLTITKDNMSVLQNTSIEFKNAILKKMNILNDYNSFLSLLGPSTSIMNGSWFGKSRISEIKRFLWNAYLLLKKNEKKVYFAGIKKGNLDDS